MRAPSLIASSNMSSMASMMKDLSAQGISRLSVCLGPGINRLSIIRKLTKWRPKRAVSSCGANLWITLQMHSFPKSHAADNPFTWIPCTILTCLVMRNLAAGKAHRYLLLWLNQLRLVCALPVVYKGDDLFPPMPGVWCSCATGDAHMGQSAPSAVFLQSLQSPSRQACSSTAACSAAMECTEVMVRFNAHD